MLFVVTILQQSLATQFTHYLGKWNPSLTQFIHLEVCGSLVYLKAGIETGKVGKPGNLYPTPLWSCGHGTSYHLSTEAATNQWFECLVSASLGSIDFLLSSIELGTLSSLSLWRERLMLLKGLGEKKQWGLWLSTSKKRLSQEHTFQYGATHSHILGPVREA